MVTINTIKQLEKKAPMCQALFQAVNKGVCTLTLTRSLKSMYCFHHYFMRLRGAKIPYLFPGEGNGSPLQYSCLENAMDRGACWPQSMGSQRVGHDWLIALLPSIQRWSGNSSWGGLTPKSCCWLLVLRHMNKNKQWNVIFHLSAITKIKTQIMARGWHPQALPAGI